MTVVAPRRSPADLEEVPMEAGVMAAEVAGSAVVMVRDMRSQVASVEGHGREVDDSVEEETDEDEARR